MSEQKPPQSCGWRLPFQPKQLKADGDSNLSRKTKQPLLRILVRHEHKSTADGNGALRTSMDRSVKASTYELIGKQINAHMFRRICIVSSHLYNSSSNGEELLPSLAISMNNTVVVANPSRRRAGMGQK